MTHLRGRISTVFFLLVLVPTVALAESIQGSILKTSASGVDVAVYDAQGRMYPNALKLKTDYKTHYSGVSSPSSLRVKDPVQVTVSQQKSGVWHADSITKLSKISQSNVPINSAPPSNALADALKSPTGQNVIKGGISGAVVGGVSSYASGGKAGKGALVGAGVGAAAGLLQGLFSQPSQQPQAQSGTTVTSDDQRNNG